MNFKQRYSNILLGAVIIVVLFSCKDIGTELPLLSGLSASSTQVSVVKGTSTHITLSGGTSPYSIKRQPNSTKAAVSLNSSILTISGIDTGSTSTLVADSKIPIADSLEIMISILGTLPLVSFSNQIQPVFNNNNQCTGCHGGSGGLTLTPGVSYNNLVNVNAQSSCTSLKRVLPNDADNSVLYRKISGTTCGSRMPQGGVLSTSEIALIRDWINQGANNN